MPRVHFTMRPKAARGHSWASIVCLTLSLAFLLGTNLAGVRATTTEGYSYFSSWSLPSLWSSDENKTNEITKSDQVVYDVTSEHDNGSGAVAVATVDTAAVAAAAATKLEASAAASEDDTKLNHLATTTAEVIKLKKPFLYASNRPKQCRTCQTGGWLDEQEEYRQRIELVKEKILHRLGLKEPPSLPDHLEVDYNLCNVFMNCPTLGLGSEF